MRKVARKVWKLLLFSQLYAPIKTGLSFSNSYDETITNKHPRNDAAYVRCVLHPLPLPLSSCLGCIPPFIRLPSLRFYAVVTSLFLLFVFLFFCLSRRCPLLATFLSVLFCLLSMLISERLMTHYYCNPERLLIV